VPSERGDGLRKSKRRNDVVERPRDAVGEKYEDDKAPRKALVSLGWHADRASEERG
jgi:hypothetical protein